jgi:hypothetical protein
MTALPAASDFTGGGITEAQFKTAITSLRSFLSELLGTSGTDRVAALSALGAILGDSLDKSGSYTVVAADKGKVINCSGTWSLALTAAATLGDGFAFSVWNNGSGVITIDPSGSEQIDGATTKTVAAGKLAIVYSDGTKFVTAGSMGSADIIAALGYTPLSIDAGVFGVGSIMHCGSSLSSVASGSTISGSSLNYLWLNGSGVWQTSIVNTGTWRNISGRTCGVDEYVPFQRIS